MLGTVLLTLHVLTELDLHRKPMSRYHSGAETDSERLSSLPAVMQL